MALDGVHEGRRREGRALALAGAGGPSQRGRRPRWGLSRRKKPLAGSVGPLGQNGPMGRPTLLTPELRVDVERELADGVPVVVVAQRFGIGRRTLGRWISEGRVVRSRREPGPQTVHGVVNAQPAPIGASSDDPFDRAEPGWSPSSSTQLVAGHGRPALGCWNGAGRNAGPDRRNDRSTTSYRDRPKTTPSRRSIDWPNGVVDVRPTGLGFPARAGVFIT